MKKQIKNCKKQKEKKLVLMVAVLLVEEEKEISLKNSKNQKEK